MIWFTLALFVVSFVIVALLAPKPEFEDARAQDLNADNFPRATENSPIPMILGKVEMRAPNTIWYGDFNALPIRERVKTGLFKKRNITVGYVYYLGFDLALCLGQNVALTQITLDEEVLWQGEIGDTTDAVISINRPNFFGGRKEGGGFIGTAHFYPGNFNQPPNEYVINRVGGGIVPAYSGVSHMVFAGFEIGETPSLRKISFTIRRYTYALGFPLLGEDINIAEALYQVMFDPWAGMGMSTDDVDIASLISIGNVLQAEGNGCSITVGSERNGTRIINELLRQADAIAYQDPVTSRIVFKLIRKDYNVNALPEFDESDVVAVRSFSRTSWEEVYSEVKISFPLRGKEGEGVAIAQDPSIIAMLGRARPTGFSFPFVYNPANANVIAARQLSQLSVPLYRFTIEMNRNAYFLKPGDVIKLSWQDYSINDVVLRVQKFNAGDLLDGKIVVDCLQDNFALDTVTFSPPEESLFEPIVNEIPNIATFLLVQMPYFFSTRILIPVADGGVQYIPMIRKPSGVSTEFTLLSGEVAGQLEIADPELVPYAGHGLLSIAILDTDGFATGFVSGAGATIISSAGDWEDTVPLTEIREGEGGLIYVGGEWMSFNSSVTTGTDTVLTGVRRGLLGTRPRNHAVGSPVYEFTPSLLPDGGADLLEGETLYYKLLNSTSLGTQDERGLTEYTVTAGTLADRPLRPAFLRIDDLRDVPIVEDQVDRTLSWRRRNRAAAQIAFEDDPDQTPDQTEVYDVDIIVGGIRDNDLSAAGVTGTSYVIPFSASSISELDCEARVFSRRTVGNLRSSADYGFIPFAMDQIPAPPVGATVYNATGADQTYTVPAGIDTLYLGLAGAGGGAGSYNTGSFSGSGGYTYVEIPVVEGDVILIQVGVGGEAARPGGTVRADGANRAGAGGWPDGGGGTFGDAPGSGGGGSTRVWKNGVLVAVAGAGGGDAGFTGRGGAGGGLSGQNSTSTSAGSGGTQIAGGVDQDATGIVAKQGLQITSPTPARTGGWGGTAQNITTSTTDDGAGGGGGYWGGGGGGGDGRAGGGGSGYIAPGFTGQTYAGNLDVPPVELTTLPDYVAGIAVGRPSQTARQSGGNGVVYMTDDPLYFA